MILINVAIFKYIFIQTNLYFDLSIAKNVGSLV